MIPPPNKAESRDATPLRHGKELKSQPATCPRGQKHDTTLTLNSKRGGFATITHNNIRNYEAKLSAKIHTDVETEPSLQPIEGETLTLHHSITQKLKKEARI